MKVVGTNQAEANNALLACTGACVELVSLF